MDNQRHQPDAAALTSRRSGPHRPVNDLTQGARERRRTESYDAVGSWPSARGIDHHGVAELLQLRNKPSGVSFLVAPG